MADIPNIEEGDNIRVVQNEEPGVDDAEEIDKKENEEILRRAKDCLELAEEAESEIRKLALEDIEFSLGNQWPDTIQQNRSREGRPCLVINRMPQFIQQITNEQRQNRPSIKVHPVGDGADEETAKIIQGLIRHIEYNSNADVAYDTAMDFSARCGFGFWRVLPGFVSPDSFDQELYIKRIKNNFSVYLDPAHQEPDGSDAAWGLILDWVQKDEYKDKFPASNLASLDWNQTGNDIPDWMREGSTLVAEYFYKTFQEETLHLLSTGESVLDRDLEKKSQDAMKAGFNIEIVKSRKTKVQTIKWVKINAVEVLEKTDWPGKYIPIVPVYGGEIYVNGKKHVEGIVRNAKDSQRMYNYWSSAQTEAIALTPKAPFIVAEGQIETYEDQWKTANTRNHSYLPYKPTSVAGQAVPPPQRQSIEPAVQSITSARMMAAEDMKATTGIYDAALGSGPTDISGIALQKRNNQTQTSNFHFMDNLTRSMKHTGRILVDLLPHYYDTARASRIIGDDGSQKQVMLNQSFKDENGKETLYSLDTGNYDVTIDVGPSYASKRQEAATSMQSLAASYPKMMDIAGDLFVKNMDWPGAQDIADRIKKTLPPGLADDPKGPQPLPPQVQAQIQQMSQMINTLSGHLNETTKIIETKKLELEHKERVAAWEIQFKRDQLQAEIETNLAKLQSQGSIELLKQEIGALKHESMLTNDRLKLIGIDQPINAQNNFDPQQADGGNYAGFGHVGGSENVTGGASPGQSVGE